MTSFAQSDPAHALGLIASARGGVGCGVALEDGTYRTCVGFRWAAPGRYFIMWQDGKEVEIASDACLCLVN